MESFHHIAKLVDRAKRFLARAVGLVRREKRNRRVSPVVDQSGRTVLSIELEDRQQFDCSDPEILEIGYFLDQSRIGAAYVLSNAGTGVSSEAADVHFIYDGSRGQLFQWGICFPIIGVGIDHHALHRRRRVVAFVPSCLPTVAFGNNNTTTIWIQKDLVGIET